MRHLQSFKYVKIIAETGSIRRAAESCAISPSALNRHIQTLELDLGFPIFDRISKGVRLSVEGELFHQFAIRQMASFAQLTSQINDIKGLRTGVVRLGVSYDLGLKFIHNQIAKYQVDHPDVAFELKSITQDELETQISTNQIDLALFYQPILNKEMHVFHAFEAQVHAALPHGTSVNDRGGLKLYELMDHPALLPAKNTQLRLKIDSACEKMGITLRTTMECVDPLPHLSATNTSRIAFCIPFPEDFHAYGTKGYKLIPIAPQELTIGYVGLVSSTANMMPAAPQRFVERLISQIDNLVEST